MPRPSWIPRPAVVLAAALALSGLGGPCLAAGTPRWDGVALRKVIDGLDSPLFLTAPPGDTTRLFVVEQPGRILIIKDGRLLPAPFLDIRDRVRAGGERGLLSVAFHPRYRENGYLYVDYTDRHGDTQVERYQVTHDPDRADPASNVKIIHIAQPYANHNGGLVAFGPDGMLYVGMGDGGSGGDPEDRAENLNELLGKLLRLDVDHGTPYTIPRDNPFASGGTGRPEIWAYGLRNPWRYSFDAPRHQLWIGDVGQNLWEEVDRVDDHSAGLDFGWRRFEGTHPFKPRGGGPTPTMPLLEYGHDDGCSVTGGVVYRGREVPALAGQYVYADYCSGWILSVRADAGRVTEMHLWNVSRPGSVASFGVDGRGELYVITLEGVVWRVVAKPPGGR